APAPPPDTTIPLRIAVARALGALRDPAAIEALVVATSDAEPDPEVRVAAAMALGDVASAAEDEEAASKAVTGLLAALNDEVGDVRVACIHALGQTSPPEDMKATVAAAVNKAKDDDDYWARKAADKTAELLRLPE
ncbi:HEAT repeat domain-containing protein, partial [bacterium]|nr:HEAT repeat domain-containing protein [bacterium]